MARPISKDEANTLRRRRRREARRDREAPRVAAFLAARLTPRQLHRLRDFVDAILEQALDDLEAP